MNVISKDHPLYSDPSRPWPYAVTVGYRAQGRKIVESRTVYVRATGEQDAGQKGIVYCREWLPALVRDGRRLKASRCLSVRPLDNGDAIGQGGAV